MRRTKYIVKSRSCEASRQNRHLRAGLALVTGPWQTEDRFEYLRDAYRFCDYWRSRNVYREFAVFDAATGEKIRRRT